MSYFSKLVFAVLDAVYETTAAHLESLHAKSKTKISPIPKPPVVFPETTSYRDHRNAQVTSASSVFPDKRNSTPPSATIEEKPKHKTNQVPTSIRNAKNRRKAKSNSGIKIFVDASQLNHLRDYRGASPSGIGVYAPSLRLGMSLEVVSSNSSEAEALAVQVGRAFAQSLGLTDFDIYTDCKFVADLCKKGTVQRPPQIGLQSSHAIATALPLPRSIEVKWIPREANRIADHLSKLASQFEKSVIISFDKWKGEDAVLSRAQFVSCALRSRLPPSGIIHLQSLPVDITLLPSDATCGSALADVIESLALEWHNARSLHTEPEDTKAIRKAISAHTAPRRCENSEYLKSA